MWDLFWCRRELNGWRLRISRGERTKGRKDNGVRGLESCSVEPVCLIIVKRLLLTLERGKPCRFTHNVSCKNVTGTFPVRNVSALVKVCPDVQIKSRYHPTCISYRKIHSNLGVLGAIGLLKNSNRVN